MKTEIPEYEPPFFPDLKTPEQKLAFHEYYEAISAWYKSGPLGTEKENAAWEAMNETRRRLARLRGVANPR